MRRKNVLVSAYFAKNVGDDLFLQVLFDRYQNINWYLLTSNRQYIDIFKNYPHVNIINSYREFGSINMFISWSKMTNHFNKYDAFVMIGGSIFMQNKEWKKTFKTRDKLIKLLHKHNIPSFIIGANFGPYKDNYFKDLYENHFLKYEGICFRDLYSYDIFSHLPNVKVAYDAVLTLETKKVKKGDFCIGISPISLYNRQDLQPFAKQYYLKCRQIIEYYIEKDYDIKLFSFCEYEGDLDSIHELLQQISEKYKKKIKVVNYTGQLDTFLNEFQSCFAIIGTRFHSLILAMKFNQPFLPIIYSDKTTYSLQSIGVENLGYHISEIDLLNISNIEDEFNVIDCDRLYEEASKQFYYLDRFLN